MLVERETIVSLFIAIVAILVIVGGYASFTGLAVYSDELSLDIKKSSYSTGDVFDSVLSVRSATFLKEESLVVYLNDNLFTVIHLQGHLDSHGLDYAVEYRDAGADAVQLINMKERLSLNLAGYVPLKDLAPGSYRIRVSFSEGSGSVDGVFAVY